MPVLLPLKRAAWRLLHPDAPPPRRRRLLEALPKRGVGAEVGVWRGDFSARILDVARPRRLYLIDPWQVVEGNAYEHAWYGGQLAGRQAEMEAVHAAVLDRFARERKKGIVDVRRTTSADAAGRFADGELDFVYIDGDHTYEFVKTDLRAFAPKLKPGGLLAGDDYGVAGWWEDGVTRAVDEFVAEGGAEVVSLADEQFLLRIRGAR